MTDIEELSFDIDGPRAMMYEELSEEFGEDVVQGILQNALQEQITQIWDTRDQLREAQRQQQPPQ